MTQTAEQLRKEAAQHRQDAVDSFDRCDTDGFLSQWASGMNADLKLARAKIAEAGGLATFTRLRLVTLDGQETDARRVNTRYGSKWRLDSTDEWLGVQPVRESTLARKGYREVEEFALAPAKAIHWAPPGARGLSGATSVQTLVLRADIEGNDVWDWRLDGYGDTRPEDACDA